MGKTLIDSAAGKRFLFILDGIVINLAYVFTTGVILSGYAMYLGAPDFIVAFLNNSANFTTVFCILSYLIFERLKNRKKVLLKLNFASRFLIFLILFLPVLSGQKRLMLAFLCIFVIASNILWGIYRVGWFVWMMESIPVKTRTGFVYYRMFLIRVFLIAATLSSGFIIDWFHKGYTGFAILFVIAFLLSVSDIYILHRISDIECKPTDKVLKIAEFLQPVQYVTYRKFLVFVFLFYLFLTLSGSFTPVYLVKYLNFNYKLISFAGVLSILSMALSSSFWGKIEIKKGVGFVLCATGYLTAVEPFTMMFLSDKTWYLLFISSIISGIGSGGFSISLLTYRFGVMPENGKTLYEGWYYFAFGVGMLLAPVVGQWMLGCLPGGAVIKGLNQFQLIYLVSFILLAVLIFMVFLKPIIGKSEAAVFSKNEL